MYTIYKSIYDEFAQFIAMYRAMANYDCIIQHDRCVVRATEKSLPGRKLTSTYLMHAPSFLYTQTMRARDSPLEKFGAAAFPVKIHVSYSSLGVS